MNQSESRNLTMVMDLYELTMANGYFNDGDREARVAFDVFYRKNPDQGGFAIFAGLSQIIDYIKNMQSLPSKKAPDFTDDFLTPLTNILLVALACSLLYFI